MEASAPMPLMSYLDEVADPRRNGYAHRHNLQEMLVIAICASLAKKRKLAAWDDTFRMAILGIKPVHDN